MAGVIGHHVSNAAVIDRLGFPLSDPATTWLALGTELAHDDLVAAADYLVLDPAVLDPVDLRPYLTISALLEAVCSFHGRSAKKLRNAARDVRQGAESRPESLLRLLLARAGLPDPVLNANVTSAQGKWIGRADLVWPQYRVIAEYDGDQHRTDAAQYEKDLSRIERFVDSGFRVVSVRSRGLFRAPDETVERVASALRAGGWTPDSSYRRPRRSQGR